MVFRYFFRALRDTIKNIFRSPIYSLINILTIGSMLFVLACVFVISVNMNSILDDVAGKLEVVAFYEYDAGESDMERIEQELLSMDSVASVDHITKAEGLESMKEEWGEEYAAIFDRYTDEDNPIPEAMIINVSDAEKISEVLNVLSEEPLVESYNDSSNVADILVKLSKYVYIGGLIIVAILLIVCALIISNTVRLTIMSKSDELEIMHFVGSPEWYIRMPYVMQSFLLSAIGSGVAIVLILELYKVVVERLNSQQLFLFSGILPYSYIQGIVIPVCLFIGCVFSILTAKIALRKYLKK